MIEAFEKILQQLKNHIYNIKIQHRSYRAAVDGLEENEILFHIDFSKNYSCKCFEEVQSHHFGGPRNQVTLHTGVMYRKSNNGKKTVDSFCTISNNNAHNPAAIWAHLHPILSNIKVNFNDISTVHFFFRWARHSVSSKTNFLLCLFKTIYRVQF